MFLYISAQPYINRTLLCLRENGWHLHGLQVVFERLIRLVCLIIVDPWLLITHRFQGVGHYIKHRFQLWTMKWAEYRREEQRWVFCARNLWVFFTTLHNESCLVIGIHLYCAFLTSCYSKHCTILPNIHPFMHPPTAVSGWGVLFSDTSTSRIELTTFRLPANPLYLLSYTPLWGRAMSLAYLGRETTILLLTIFDIKIIPYKQATWYNYEQNNQTITIDFRG